MPRANETMATMVTNGVLKSVRRANLRLGMADSIRRAPRCDGLRERSADVWKPHVDVSGRVPALAEHRDSSILRRIQVQTFCCTFGGPSRQGTALRYS